jgi:RNase P protein component
MFTEGNLYLNIRCDWFIIKKQYYNNLNQKLGELNGRFGFQKEFKAVDRNYFKRVLRKPIV